MIDSLDPNDSLLSHLGLFSSECEAMLNLDSNLAFENIWINEDPFGTDMNNDRFHMNDHTYSQQDERSPEVDVDELETRIVTQDPKTTEPTRDTRVADIGDLTNSVNNPNEEIDENDEILHREHKVSTDQATNGHIDLTNHQQLSDENGTSSLDPEAVSVNSSLSFLLEETNCQTFDLNCLLEDELQMNNLLGTNHQEVISQPAVSRQELDSLVGNDDNHTLTALVSNMDKLNEHKCGLTGTLNTLNVHDSEFMNTYSLETTNDYNMDPSFLDTLNDTQTGQSLINLDFSDAFDSLTRLDDAFDSLTRLDGSDSSQWSTLSSGMSELPMDWEETQDPLRLEEYYNRTFNEALNKVEPCQPDACSFYQPLHVDIGEWSSVRWDTSEMSSVDNSMAVRHRHSECNETSRGHEQSLTGNKPSDSSNKPVSAESKPGPNRLGTVRKYQRLNTNRCVSEPLERNFQCSYPTCLKFYAKFTHLKAHLRRHSGERAFKCDWQDCSWQFSRSDELSRHRRSHYGIKPYPCTQCVKRFTRSDHLAKHLKVHERQKYKMLMKSLRKMNKKK